ncbi:hypothetical protein B0O80DRAFT_456364 [Mortierella sp. GBAus27b]|nr:hypothetical protein B0O80DRAFT_456364 [Mortierella sp. GBAus27b]
MKNVQGCFYMVLVAHIQCISLDPQALVLQLMLILTRGFPVNSCHFSALPLCLRCRESNSRPIDGRSFSSY